LHFRLQRFKQSEVLTEGTTWSEELPGAGVLDHILATFRVYNNGAQYDRAKPHIWDHLSKIVVKGDGVESAFDAWGQTVLAEYAVQYGKLPPGYIDLMSSNYQSLAFPIMFGRKLKDGKMGLDLSKFKDLRLELTNDWVVGDLQATKNIWLDLDLYFLENAPVPANYIGTSQIASHTWTANSQKYTFKVPTKYPVRRIFLGCESWRSDGQGAQSSKAYRNLRYLKYTYKSGSIVVKDDDLFRNDQDQLWGHPDFVEVLLNAEPRTDYTVDVGLCRPTVFLATPSYSADPGSDTELTVDQRMERLLKWRRADAGFQARVYAAGYGVMDHICLHEDDPDDTGGYLNPATMADVEVEVGNNSASASDGTIRFITQHLRSN
jgi:hypothetical protein